MEHSAATEWIHARQDEAEKQRKGGNDPFQRQIRRHARRERLLLAGATVMMGVVVSTFYAVLIR